MTESILDRIKYLANKKKLSLSEIERQAGLAKTSIYTWKNKVPNAKNIEKIADILDTTSDYLLGRSNNPKPIDKKDDPALFFRIDMQNVPEEKRPEFKKQLGLLKDYMLDQLEKMEKEDDND